jgi:hypothetical protein
MRYPERFPVTWNGVIEKESLEMRELEHVLIEKVEQLFRDVDPSNVSLFCALTRAEHRTYLKAGPSLFNKYLMQRPLGATCHGRFRSRTRY